MKVKLLSLFFICLVLIYTACSKHPSNPLKVSEQDIQTQKAIAQAEKNTKEVIDLALKANFTGDLTDLKEYLSEKDQKDVVKRLLKENNIELEAPLQKPLGPLGLPDFSQYPGFEDGSVLLSRTVGSPTSDLIAWILPGLYTHSGVLDQELYIAPDIGCVITANLDGVTYETYNDWNGATTVSKLNVDRGEVTWPDPSLDYLQNWIIRRYQGWTIYAFLRFNLEPISRDNQLFWYCSKTVWKLFDRMDIDVENANWYLDKLMLLRQSGLYQLYKSFLMFFFSEQQATALADAKLCRVVGELITPDEVRFATTDHPSGTEGGDLDPNTLETWGIPEP